MPVPTPLLVSGTYSIAEAATRLGIGTSTAYDLLARGEFPVPVVRIGKTYKIKRAVLEAWLDPETTEGSASAQASSEDKVSPFRRA